MSQLRRKGLLSEGNKFKTGYGGQEQPTHVGHGFSHAWELRCG